MDNTDLVLQNIEREEEENQTKKLATKLNVPYVNLINFPIEPDVLAIVPEDQAQAYQVIAYLREGDKIKIATSNPQEPKLKSFLDNLALTTQSEFALHYCSASSLRYGLSLYKVLMPELPTEAKIAVTAETEKAFEQEIQTLSDLQEKIAKVSTTELLDTVFAGAIKNDATDIHLEPQENEFRIRFRLDGVLEDVAKLPISAYHAVMSRVKYLAKLKLDVTHPQDGRFSIDVLSNEVDVRVATVPTLYGESVVMRLLPKQKSYLDLDGLGFNTDALAVIKEAMTKPQGMILVTGPTGSGKSTTLYAILQKLNQPGKKIITLENPIEYRVEGIEQIQIDVENKTGFLEALKGALRQDPDIMMIGEIRDAETAGIALQAAMTGHSVLSTLHTNNAPASLARLTDMGVAPYLLAGSINLIIAQRLVRMIHQECQGKGCTICHNTGFKGRTAIIEVLVPTKEIEDLIYQKAALRTFEETAHKQGMRTMYEDGLDKVAQGLTVKEEIERVTKEYN